MSAHWPVTTGEIASDAPLRRVGLVTLLNATARRHPERIALVDPADKPLWSGRPAITWTYAAAAEIVERLARGLRAWRLPPGSRIGLCMPGSAESALALLAVEASGHIACVLPVAWNEDTLLAAAQEAGIAAILTQARVGALPLAERLCGVAVRYFGLRYLAAFGPDVPDGVINLDALVLDARAAEAAPSPRPASAGIVSFACGEPERPVHRSAESLIAAAAVHLVAMRPAPGERILSLLGPHDLRGLATGLAAALVAGGCLETLPVFDGAAFAAALARPVPTHLAAPAMLEPNLAGRPMPDTVRSVTLVHRAPTRFPPRARPAPGDAIRAAAVIDAVAFDETALLSGRRGGAGDIALVLGRPERLALPSNLMGLRHESDGRLAFRGQACATSRLERGVPVSPEYDAWTATPYAALLYAGLAIAVAPHATDAAADAPNFFATA